MTDIRDLDPTLCDAIDQLPGDAGLHDRIKAGLTAARLQTNDRIGTHQLRQVMAHGSLDLLRLLPFRSSREGVFTPQAWAELVERKSPDEVREMGRRGAALSNAMLAICTAACHDPGWDDLAVEIACDEALMIETLLGHDLFTPVCRERPDLVERMLVDLANARPEGELENAFRTFADAGLISAFAALWLAVPSQRFGPDLFDRIGQPLFWDGAQHGSHIVALSQATSNHSRIAMTARLPSLSDLLRDPETILDLDRELRSRDG